MIGIGPSVEDVGLIQQVLTRLLHDRITWVHQMTVRV
jgi:hypothetical protein